MKTDLAGNYMDKDSFKVTWDGVIRDINLEEFNMAYRKWPNRHAKCLEFEGNYD